MNDQVTFLVVEDNADDATLLRCAFKEANILNPIHLVSSAKEAIEYLSGLGKYQNRFEFPLPALILLDLNMPGMDGCEFLKWLRAHHDLHRLRVVVLSGSDDTRDINLAYQLGANSVLVKPSDFPRLVEMTHAVSSYWLLLDHAPETVRPLHNLSLPITKTPHL